MMANFNLILGFLFSAIDAIVFINLLSYFRKSMSDYKYTNIIVTAVISVIIFSLTLLGVTPYIKVVIISIILFVITFLYRLQFYERLLSVALYYFILIGSELLVTLLISNILGIDIETIGISYNYSFLFLGMVSKFLNIIILSAIKRRLIKDKILLPKILNYTIISILLLSSISMVLLLYSSLNLPFIEVEFILFIICLFILFMSIGVLIIYFSANKFYIHLQEETTKSTYNKSLERFILNAKRREDLLSKIWHDLQNHIKILEEIGSKSDKDYFQYLNSIKSQISDIPNKINSGNRLINIVLNDKYAEATSLGINFDAKAVAPPKLNVNDIDLSSILFNTIDNAIEACLNDNVSDKYIFLEIYPNDNFLYYRIKNNYNPIGNNSSKKLHSNKKNYITSGYGLKIIEDIVEKHDGHMDIDKENMEFSITIILNLNS